MSVVSGLLDYSAGVSVNGYGFTASFKGVWVICAQWNNGSSIYIKVNGVNAYALAGTSGYQDQCSMYIPLNEGDVISWSSSPSKVHFSVMYPFKTE